MRSGPVIGGMPETRRPPNEPEADVAHGTWGEGDAVGLSYSHQMVGAGTTLIMPTELYG